jgi:catalase
MQRDGMMQTLIHKGRANYEPNSLDVAGEDQGPRPSDQGFQTIRRMDQSGEDANQKLRVRAETFADHFSHARLFYRSQTGVEQDHIASAFTFELSKVDLPHVRINVLAQLRNVDEALAERVAKGLGLDLPPRATPAREPVDMPVSNALSILKNAHQTLEGRKVGILMDEDSDMSEVKALVSGVEKAGGIAMIIAPRRGLCDGQLDGSPSAALDAVALVLTDAAAQKLCQHKPAIDFVSDAFAHCKAIGHSEAAQPLLDKAGVVPDAGIVNLSMLPAAAVRRYYDRETVIWAAHA